MDHSSSRTESPSRTAASTPENGLLSPAMPLLQLLARLRTMASQPDPTELRQRTENEIRNFEARAEKAGLTADRVKRGSYALCASLDDAVLATPWGYRGDWADHPLVATFHPSVGPGRFFDLLRQAEEKADTLLPVLELMFACLSLGMLGSYRDRPGGVAEVAALREKVAVRLARQCPAPPGELAVRWRGVDAPLASTRAARFPVWVAAMAGLALVGGCFLFVSHRVNEQAGRVVADMLAAPPALMPVITRHPVPPPLDRRMQNRRDEKGGAP